MKRTFPSTYSMLLVFGLTLLLAGPSFADQGSFGSSSSLSGDASHTAAFDHYRMSEILDMDVKDQNGETLGSIEDVVFGSDGRINFVVLGRGGLFGIGQTLTPLPWGVVSSFPRTDEESFVANIEKDKLNEAPNFTAGNWPDLNSPDWSDRVFGYYGMEEHEQDNLRTYDSQTMEHEFSTPGVLEHEFKETPGDAE